MKTPTIRKIVAIGFLLITCLPGLLFLYLDLKQRHIRHKMEEKLERSSLQEVRIPENSLVWYEEGRELIIDDKLFDVLSIRVEKGIAIVSGLFDYEETRLKDQVERLQRQQEKEDEGGSDFLVSFSAFFIEDHAVSLHHPVSFVLKHNSYWQFRNIEPIQDIICPPPKQS